METALDALARDAGESPKKKLRILYVWDADYPWDIRTEKIARALTAHGHEVHIAARNKAWRKTAEVLPEATVHRMPPIRLVGKRLDNILGFPAFFSPRWIRLLDRIVRENRIDVIIVRDLPLCPTGIWVARRRGIPVVWDMAEDYPGMMKATWDAGRQGAFDILVRNPRAVQAIERYCLPRLDRIIVTVAEAGDRIVALGADRHRISIVHNSPPVKNAEGNPARDTGTSDAPVRVVYLGILELPRGIGELLEAIAELRTSGENFALTIIGGGRDEEILRDRARALGLDESAVKFAGFVPHEQAIRMVAEADIGVNPLHDSPVFQTCIPNKLFDYMAAGLPVVSSDMQACARLLRETGAGEVFSAGDSSDLASALKRLRDAATRKKIGEQGRDAVKKRYNWEEDSRVLVETVERAINA